MMTVCSVGVGGVRFGGLKEKKVETTSGRAYTIHTSKLIAGSTAAGGGEWVGWEAGRWGD